MLRQLNNLSRYTSSSIKYAANNTAALVGLSAGSRDDPTLPSPQLVSYWIAETQRGLDAFFNDQFDLAQSILMQHQDESPFHAVGYALMSFVEALLSFESEKIQIAAERINAAELLARQYAKKAKKRNWYPPLDESNVASLSFEDNNNDTRRKRVRTADIQYELIATHCILMASTLQFLRNSWLDYMKAAYKLRKAYRLYEQMFESLTGQKTSEYASVLRSSRRSSLSDLGILATAPPPSLSPTLNEKRASMFHPRTTSFDSLVTTLKQRPASILDNIACDSLAVIENSIESGIFFGIGLFSLVFSLLPPRVNKILNTLGFHSSRPFALHLLTRSFNNRGLYSPLSALTLLAYYTNLSLFIHPHLLPSSLRFENARLLLDQMKIAYPEGKVWKLLEGKLSKMEGKTRRGVEILRDARRRDNTRVHFGKSYQVVRTKEKSTYDLAQLQALAVYEMGWGQVFLGDYFQASETFFRLESMNNWSRAFYHYIATCCMFADEEYDKAAVEFMQIPAILKRKCQLGGKWLPNEIFAERKIKHWMEKARKLGFSKKRPAHHDIILDGAMLKRVVAINPLWELIYLWNGFSQLTPCTLQLMKQSMETILANTPTDEIDTDMALLYLLLGVSVRELGDFDLADMYLQQSMRADDGRSEDRWVLSHCMYEMAALKCFQLLQCTKAPTKKVLLKEAHEWIRKSERQLATPDSVPTDTNGDSDWDSRIHVRCQLLIEKLEDIAKSIADF